MLQPVGSCSLRRFAVLVAWFGRLVDSIIEDLNLGKVMALCTFYCLVLQICCNMNHIELCYCQILLNCLYYSQLKSNCIIILKYIEPSAFSID